MWKSSFFSNGWLLNSMNSLTDSIKTWLVVKPCRIGPCLPFNLAMRLSNNWQVSGSCFQLDCLFGPDLNLINSDIFMPLHLHIMISWEFLLQAGSLTFHLFLFLLAYISIFCWLLVSEKYNDGLALVMSKVLNTVVVVVAVVTLWSVMLRWHHDPWCCRELQLM